MERSRLEKSFFLQDVLTVAPALIGKYLVRRFPDGNQERFAITETEAYRGFEDKACHASKGRTVRTEAMFHDGGILYMYLIYGIHWMLNVVTAPKNVPQAVLIRGVKDIEGPGRVTRTLQLNKDFYGEDLQNSDRIWIEDTSRKCRIIAGPRVGIDYAGTFWKNKPWRYIMVY